MWEGVDASVSMHDPIVEEIGDSSDLLQDGNRRIKGTRLKRNNSFGSTHTLTSITSCKDDPFPDESTNWYRVVALLFYIGTAVLRHLLLVSLRKAFKQEYATLKDAIFDKSGAHPKLVSKKKGSLFRSSKDDLLSEENFDEDKLDITTLVQILLELKLKNDKRLLSDKPQLKNEVEKIRGKRNSLLHLSDPRLNQIEFEKEWEDLKAILNVLDIDSNYTDDIDGWRVKRFGQKLRNEIITRAQHIERVNINKTINNIKTVHHHHHHHYSPSLTRRSSMRSVRSLPSQLSLEMDQSDQPKRLLVIGDDNYMKIEIEGIEVHNISKEGLTYSNFVSLLKILDSTVVSDVCLCLGTFDLEKENDDDQVKIAITRGIQELDYTFDNSTIYVLSILPHKETNESTKAFNARIRLMNEFIKKCIEANDKMCYIDVFDAILEHQKRKDNCYLIDSSILLSTEGKQIVTHLLRENLKYAIFESPNHQDIETMQVQERIIHSQNTMVQQMQALQLEGDDELREILTEPIADVMHESTEERVQYVGARPKTKTTNIAIDNSDIERQIGSLKGCESGLPGQGPTEPLSVKNVDNLTSVQVIVSTEESVLPMSLSTSVPMKVVPTVQTAEATFPSTHHPHSYVSAQRNQPLTTVPTTFLSKNQPSVAVITENQRPTPVSTQSQPPTPVSTQSQPPTPVSTQSQPPTPVSTQSQPPTPVSTQNQPPTPVSTQNQPPTPVSTQNQSPTPVSTQNQPPTPVSTQDQHAPSTVHVAPLIKEKAKRNLINRLRYIRFGEDSVITESDNHLYKYMVDGADGRIRQVLQMTRPNDVSKRSEKYMLNDGSIALQDAYNAPIHVFSRKFEHKLQLGTISGEFGMLCGAFGNHVIYSKKDRQSDNRLHVFSVSNYSESPSQAGLSHELVATLSKSVTSYGVSVCRHHTGYLAISDGKASTLDIYTHHHQHVTRIQIDDHPLGRNALAAVGDVIVVALWGSNSLSLYNWAGERLAVLTTDQLGVAGQIQGIGGAGSMLLLATAPWSFSNVSTLHVYDIC